MAAQPLRGPFTVDAYHRLGELGILREDDRVELIDGQVVEMSPIGERHASCVRRLNGLLSRQVRDRAVVDVQNPVVLGEKDAPQPDLAVLKQRIGGYPRHPRAADILLVIEVADTTLAYDRGVKLPRYAAASVPEAWVVDLVADSITVCRQPGPERYREIVTATRGQTVRPLLLPDAALAVDEILD